MHFCGNAMRGKLKEHYLNQFHNGGSEPTSVRNWKSSWGTTWSHPATCRLYKIPTNVVLIVEASKNYVVSSVLNANSENVLGRTRWKRICNLWVVQIGMNTCPGVYQRINKGGACSNHGAVKGGAKRRKKPPQLYLLSSFCTKAEWFHQLWWHYKADLLKHKNQNLCHCHLTKLKTASVLLTGTWHLFL